MTTLRGPILGFLTLLGGCTSESSTEPPVVDPDPEPGGSCVGVDPMNGLAGYGSDVANWLLESQLVVHGTITGTSSVRIDQILWTDPWTDVSAFVGHDVAIELRAPLPLGSQQIFFTTVRSQDATLALWELGTIAAPQLEPQILSLIALFAAHPLYARVASSARVVVGTVMSLDEVTGDGLGSEHSPMLVPTEVEIEQTLCGSVTPMSDVGYASSQDIAWYRAPKLSLGQTSIFLMHYSDSETMPQDTLLVLDPLDVQPTSALATIQQLLANPPSQ